jgi:hypothetical protein
MKICFGGGDELEKLWQQDSTEVLLLSSRRDIVILCGENIFCDILAGAHLA